MIKFKSALNPEVAQLIIDRYPVVKKRTALWFFTDELNKKWKQEPESDSSYSQSNNSPATNNDKRPKRADIWSRWKKMDPESKRKYFNMAELDEVRYKEQKSIWIAEIGSLLAKHGNEFNKMSELVPNRFKTQGELLELDRYQKNCECMIQTQSTRMLYKDIIEKTKNLDLNLATEKLILAVPEDYRPILSRPRRPAPAFILYTSDHKDQLSLLRREKYPKMPFLKLASVQWTNLSQKKRMIYENKYNQLVEEYNAAMQQFKNAMLESEDRFLEQATKEKKAFRKSLRRRLREYAVIPLNVRNAFNFFLMDNRDIPLTKLTETWRHLSEEEKEKYKQMNHQDMIRYYNEKSAYENFMKSLQQIDKRKTQTLYSD